MAGSRRLNKHKILIVSPTKKKPSLNRGGFAFCIKLIYAAQGHLSKCTRNIHLSVQIRYTLLFFWRSNHFPFKHAPKITCSTLVYWLYRSWSYGAYAPTPNKNTNFRARWVRKFALYICRYRPLCGLCPWPMNVSKRPASDIFLCMQESDFWPYEKQTRL